MNSNNYSLIFTEDGFVNVSSIAVFPPIYSSALSIGNSTLFLTLFISYFVCFGVLLFRISRKNVIKRNQKIIFTLIAFLVLIQSSNLFVRIIYDCLLLDSRIVAQRGERVTTQFFKAIYSVGSISSFLMMFNILFLVSIMCVVKLIFWKTARDMRAISESVYKWTRILATSFTILVGIIYIMFNIVANVFFVLSKIQLFSSTIFFYFTIVMFVLVVIFLINDTIGVLISGYFVLRTIRKVTKQVHNSTSEHSNPFIVTLSLLLGLLSCVFLQIVAACIAVVGEDFRYIWHFINNTGILIFAILALVLFYPILHENKKIRNDSNKRESTAKILEGKEKDFFAKVQDQIYTSERSNNNSELSSSTMSQITPSSSSVITL